ncbi:MAG TPA: nitrous oxide reductase accessory protein NosL [Thermodesulfobacteriota bacterium]|nr:nitrous oxide reductase accessory protein NosL [Thermodesulfobacteriota bacterium]
MKRKYLLVLFIVIGICSCRDKIDTGPQAVHYGEDVCERCRMIISDKRFAAQFINQKGEAVKFDDVGCMADYMKEQGNAGQKPLAVYVADFSTGEWLDAEKAYYLRNPGLGSPMGYNIAAFGTEEEMNGSSFRKEGKEAGGFGDLVK